MQTVRKRVHQLNQRLAALPLLAQGVNASLQEMPLQLLMGSASEFLRCTNGYVGWFYLPQR